MSEIVELTNNIAAVKQALEQCTGRILEESAAMLESQVKQNTAVDTGQTKNAWTHVIDLSQKEAIVGNPLENAVWEEFGTGEYALEGNGRKGGWFYRDAEGKGHFTHGKKPRRALHNAFASKKTAVIRNAENIIKDEMG